MTEAGPDELEILFRGEHQQELQREQQQQEQQREQQQQESGGGGRGEGGGEGGGEGAQGDGDGGGGGSGEGGGEEDAAAAAVAAVAPWVSSSPAGRISRIVICPCSATEVKGAIMRMLTRLHLEKEFRVGGGGRAAGAKA